MAARGHEAGEWFSTAVCARARETTLSLFGRWIFAVVEFAAPNGLQDSGSKEGAQEAARRRRTGMHGESYAYWHLRRHGCILVARNLSLPGAKGEIDRVGYGGPNPGFR
jgi:hypothetical protein